MTTSIYALKHPMTNEVRYIGKTVNTRSRMKTHLGPSKTKYHYPVQCWIRKLASNGLLPTMQVLVVVPDDLFADYEKAVIKLYREKINPSRMLNVTDGGDGQIGRIISDETRERLRISHLGKKQSVETREKRAASNRGLKRSPEHCANISKRCKGVPIYTDAQKKQMSIDRKGRKHTEETKTKMRIAQLKRYKS